MVSWEITVALKKTWFFFFFISFWRSVLSLLHYLPMEFCSVKNAHNVPHVVITPCNDTRPSFFFFSRYNIIWTLSEIEYTESSTDGLWRFPSRSYLTAKLYYTPYEKAKFSFHSHCDYVIIVPNSFLKKDPKNDTYQLNCIVYKTHNEIEQ